MSNFPPHNPDFPDVDPATGDERETTEGEAMVKPSVREAELRVVVNAIGWVFYGPADSTHPITINDAQLELLNRAAERALDHLDKFRGYTQFEPAPPEEYDF